MGQREQVEAKKILRQASAWYHQAFLEDPKAQQALRAIGLTDVSLEKRGQASIIHFTKRWGSIRYGHAKAQADSL